MSDIPAKLRYTLDTKTGIKEAIIERGVEVPGEGKVFRGYAALIRSIPSPADGLAGVLLTREVNNQEGQVNIPQEVEILGDYVLAGIADMTTVQFNSNANIQEIGDYAFAYSGLTSCTIPDTVETFGDYMFAGCEDLVTVTLPDTCTKITEGMFKGCTNLVTVYANNITEIEDYAFDGCVALTNTGLDVSAVTRVGKYAFHDCGAHVYDMIYSAITTIDEHAFDGSQVMYAYTTDSKPSSLTTINDGAFANGTFIRSGSGVMNEANLQITSLGNNVFENTTFNANSSPMSGTMYFTVNPSSLHANSCTNNANGILTSFKITSTQFANMTSDDWALFPWGATQANQIINSENPFACCVIYTVTTTPEGGTISIDSNLILHTYSNGHYVIKGPEAPNTNTSTVTASASMTGYQNSSVTRTLTREGSIYQQDVIVLTPEEQVGPVVPSSNLTKRGLLMGNVSVSGATATNFGPDNYIVLPFVLREDEDWTIEIDSNLSVGDEDENTSLVYAAGGNDLYDGHPQTGASDGSHLVKFVYNSVNKVVTIHDNNTYRTRDLTTASYNIMNKVLIVGRSFGTYDTWLKSGSTINYIKFNNETVDLSTYTRINQASSQWAVNLNNGILSGDIKSIGTTDTNTYYYNFAHENMAILPFTFPREHEFLFEFSCTYDYSRNLIVPFSPYDIDGSAVDPDFYYMSIGTWHPVPSTTTGAMVTPTNNTRYTIAIRQKYDQNTNTWSCQYCASTTYNRSTDTWVDIPVSTDILGQPIIIQNLIGKQQCIQAVDTHLMIDTYVYNASTVNSTNFRNYRHVNQKQVNASNGIIIGELTVGANYVSGFDHDSYMVLPWQFRSNESGVLRIKTNYPLNWSTRTETTVQSVLNIGDATNGLKLAYNATNDLAVIVTANGTAKSLTVSSWANNYIELKWNAVQQKLYVNDVPAQDGNGAFECTFFNKLMTICDPEDENTFPDDFHVEMVSFNEEAWSPSEYTVVNYVPPVDPGEVVPVITESWADGLWVGDVLEDVESNPDQTEPTPASYTLTVTIRDDYGYTFTINGESKSYRRGTYTYDYPAGTVLNYSFGHSAAGTSTGTITMDQDRTLSFGYSGDLHIED